MENLGSTNNNGVGTGETEQRRKPGPQKKTSPRSEKLSCRLTKDEKAAGEAYCKAHGITEAKLLRASYLAAVSQTPSGRIDGIAEAIARHLKEPDEQSSFKANIKEILRRSALVSLLLLFTLTFFTNPTVAKYFLHVYEAGKSIIYGPNDACIYHTGEIGCEMVPMK